MEPEEDEEAGEPKERHKRKDEKVVGDYGTYSVKDTLGWVAMNPAKGDVLVTLVPPEVAEVEDIIGAFVVVNTKMMPDGSLMMGVKSLGTTDPDCTSKLSSLFNRKAGTIHLCAGDYPCTIEEDCTFHSKEVEWLDGESFKADYVGATGKRLLSKVISEVQEEEKAEKARRQKEERRQRGTDTTPGHGKGRGNGADCPETKDPKAKDYKDLRRRLDVLKQREAAKNGTQPAKGEAEDSHGDGGNSDVSGSPPQQRLRDGKKIQVAQAVQEFVRGENTRDLAGHGGRRERTTTALKKLEPAKSVGSQLVLRAAVKSDPHGRREERSRKREKSRSRKRQKEKEKKKKDKKEKKRKERKKRRGEPSGGDSSGDGYSSDSSSTRTKRSRKESEVDSEDSGLLPPLKGKSTKRPGSVLKLLLSQIESQLSEIQGADRSTEPLLEGTKVVSYFHLLVKGSGVVSTTRDGRELFLLANLIDLLRTGQLARLGDGMASRFLALQQASLDGHWNAARHLEIHTPELQTAAGAAMTLAARRHAKIVDKAKGLDSYKERGDGGKGTWAKG